MQNKRWYASLALVLFAVVIGFGAWKVTHPSDAAECFACKRAVHAHTRTIALVDGHLRVFCCPACALSEHQQENKPVTVKQLTSFSTGAALSPTDAYVVRGSNVNMCVHTQQLLNDDKRSAGVVYDRCAPSLIAFAKRTEAAEFAQTHGGAVIPFQEAAAAYAK